MKLLSGSGRKNLSIGLGKWIAGCLRNRVKLGQGRKYSPQSQDCGLYFKDSSCFAIRLVQVPYLRDWVLPNRMAATSSGLPRKGDPADHHCEWGHDGKAQNA